MKEKLDFLALVTGSILLATRRQVFISAQPKLRSERLPLEGPFIDLISAGTSHYLVDD